MRVKLRGHYRCNYQASGGQMSRLEYEPGEVEMTEEVFNFVMRDAPQVFAFEEAVVPKEVSQPPVDKMVRKRQVRTK